jgi:EAL domain-containing protein (putative c-di-GMP-specific phosphodiesterase class I)
MLSAAIDFAAVVSALISPELERQGALDDARGKLREVIRDQAFVPHFQPIRDLTTDVTVGYEALTRWNDGTRPDLRFAEASALGMDEEIQCATLEVQIAAAEQLDPEVWLSVNVSAAVAASGALGDLLAHTDRSIVLELTEHEPIDDYESLSAAVRALPGVRVAVDDAGAGYSSIRHVLDLRPELVKLDISWVRGLDVDPARQALISGMTGFATELGCLLIAEGIETDGELRALRRLGITLGQGYLLGRPAPVETWVTQ